MGKKNLMVSVQRDTSTIIDPLYSVLAYLNLIPFDKVIFAGVSNLVFRFSVNRSLEFQSTFIYNWNANWLATDFIGIYSNMHSSFTDDLTFPLYQRKLLQSIKQNLDDGIPSIIWRDDFVVVTGYHDGEELLFYSDGNGEHPLAYHELGYSSIPMWCIHLFSRDKIEIHPKELYLESIFQAVYHSKHHDTTLDCEEFACGVRVYDFIHDALSGREAPDCSVGTTLSTFIKVKLQMCRYFIKIQSSMPKLKELLDDLEELVAVLSNLQKRLENVSDSVLISQFQDAKRLEMAFFQKLEKTFQTEFHNRMGSFWLR
ncbi:hypothetical protein [Pseudoneobacillus sp. C159]